MQRNEVRAMQLWETQAISAASSGDKSAVVVDVDDEKGS